MNNREIIRYLLYREYFKDLKEPNISRLLLSNNLENTIEKQTIAINNLSKKIDGKSDSFVKNFGANLASNAVYSVLSYVLTKLIK